MAGEEYRACGRRWVAGFLGAMALLAAGCVSDGDKRDAVNAINAEFRKDYEGILAKNGTRVYKVTRTEAYDAIRVSLAGLGMTAESQDPVLGYVNVFAPAPLPLSPDEWGQAADADLPRTRQIIRPHVGIVGDIFFNFEPKGIETVISGAVVEVPAGTEVSFTARVRETAPPQSGFPRREYLPPTAVRMGLDKMWDRLEREFRATRRKP